MPEMPIDKIENKEEVTKIEDLELLSDIIAESKEHIESIEMSSLVLESNNEDMEIINAIFRAFHSIKGLSGFVNQKNVQRVAHDTETLLDGCKKQKFIVNRDIIDIILKSSDLIKNIYSDLSLNQNIVFLNLIEEHINKIQVFLGLAKKDQSASPANIAPPVNKIGEILMEAGKITQDELDEILKKQKESYQDLKFGQIAVKEGKVSAKDIVDSIRAQGNSISAKEGAAKQQDNQIIKVSAKRVDSLLNLHGELLILNLLLHDEADKHFEKNSAAMNYLNRMTSMIKELQNESLALSMVSLKSTFQKLQRIARDTSTELNKPVEIYFEGDETEVDRTIAEKLFDPLMHILRNSISHGIEAETERVNKGKDRKGKICVRAYSKRENVFLEIEDDGQGMNIDLIMAKAKEKGLVDVHRTYSDDEILEFVLLPGFSTKSTIDNISGRGVGMDVVKTEVSKIGGRVDISSKIGQGCKIKLKIPINLALLNGTVIIIRDTRFIVPTAYIRQILNPQQKHWKYVHGKKKMVQLYSDLISIFPIEEICECSDMENNDELMLIVELDQMLMAIPVTEVVSRQEVVVKPLGKYFSNLNYAYGASILGDGKVTIILDIEALFGMQK